MIRLVIQRPYFDLAVKTLRLKGFNNISPDTADKDKSMILCGDVDTAIKARKVLRKENIKTTIIDNTEVQ